MKYFIDTNIIIDLLKKNENAIKKIVEIANEEASELYINRLVCLESLRTIHFENSKIFRESKKTLEAFEKLEINPKIYEEAIVFSRYCHSKGMKLKGKCEAIDFIHFITAKYNQLTIISNDKDFEKLEENYHNFKK